MDIGHNQPTPRGDMSGLPPFSSGHVVDFGGDWVLFRFCAFYWLTVKLQCESCWFSGKFILYFYQAVLIISIKFLHNLRTFFLQQRDSYMSTSSSENIKYESLEEYVRLNRFSGIGVTEKILEHIQKTLLNDSPKSSVVIIHSPYPPSSQNNQEDVPDEELLANSGLGAGKSDLLSIISGKLKWEIEGRRKAHNSIRSSRKQGYCIDYR